MTFQPLPDDLIRQFASDGSINFALQAGAAPSSVAAARTNWAIQFLKLILLVMIYPPNAVIINQITTLPKQSQEVLEVLIREVDPSHSSSDDENTHEGTDLDSDQTGSDDDAVSSAQRLNRDLAFEAEQAELQAKLNRREREVESLEAENKALNVAYDRLQESNEALKKQSAEYEDHVKALTSAHNDLDHSSIRDLEVKISHQEEIISSKDFRISEHQGRQTELERRISKLNGMADEFQKLQDEFHIQKRDLLEQTKKANAGEHYKQKIQANQMLEKDRDSLRRQLEELRPRLKAYDELRRDNARLAKENREISSTLSQSEIGNSELRETKQGVVAENDRLRRELRALREAYAQGQDNTADLEYRSNGSDNLSSPTIVDGGLESELTVTSKHEEQMQVATTSVRWMRKLMAHRKSRMVDLEKQNRDLLDEASEKEHKTSLLQRQLDSAQTILADRSANDLQLRQDFSDLESSMSNLQQGHILEGSVSPHPSPLNQTYSSESNQAFKRLRAELNKERQERVDLEKSADNDRTSSFERHCIVSGMTVDLLVDELAGAPKVESIDEIRKQSFRALSQVQGELDALKGRYARLQIEFDKQQAERNEAWFQSHEAIVSKAQQDAELAAKDQTFKDLADLIEKATSKDKVDFRATVQSALEPIVEGNRARIADSQQVEKQLIQSHALSVPSLPKAPLPSPSATPPCSNRSSWRFFLSKDANII